MSYLFLSPLQYQFMLNAFLMVFIISLPASIISCYLVLKGWALLGDAISHAVLPGVVIAYLLGIPLVLGAFVAGMICSMLAGFFSENSRVKKDSVLGVVFSGMFAIGLVLHLKISTDVHLDHILFGNILGIALSDLFVSGFISLLVFCIIILKRRDLMLHSFDPIQAQLVGLRSGLLHYGLLIMISLTVVSSLASVGIILSIGILIAPGAIAFLITRSFHRMLIVALLTSLFAGFLGVYLSFFIDSAPAPTVIVIFSLVFAIVFFGSQFSLLLRDKRVINREGKG